MMNETRACPFCGEEILAAAKKCKHCGEFLDGSRPQAPQHAGPQHEGYGGAEFVVPMMKNGWALAARFCSYFAILPFIGVLFGLVGIILGFLGLGYCNRNPGSLGKGSSLFAIIWGGFFIILWVFLFLMAVAAS